jgi:hypothetical protein
MYRKIEPPLRMTKNEAAERFPDSYILIRLDTHIPSNCMGTVLYVGDDGDELFALARKLDDPTNCLVTEGLYVQGRYVLGGLVVDVRN